MSLATTASPTFLLVVFGLAIVLIIWGILSSRKRTQELIALAPQLGFTFMGKAWSGPPLDGRYKTCLLQRTRGGFSNVMVGVTGGLEAMVFDYGYQANRSSINQTIACFPQKLGLPPFSLKPEGLLDRIGDAIVHNDIDFDSHPGFSSRFALKSPDEAGTRRLFTPSLLTTLEQMPSSRRWIIESNGNQLFIYSHGWIVPSAGLVAFLQETSGMARAIASSDGLKNFVG
jgi:hypothetical protein